jgi:hypothetical protein
MVHLKSRMRRCSSTRCECPFSMITALYLLSRPLLLLSIRCWLRGLSMPPQWDITTSRRLTPPRQLHRKLSMHPSSTTRRCRYKCPSLGQHSRGSKMGRGQYPRLPSITHDSRPSLLLIKIISSTSKESTSKRPMLNTHNRSPIGRKQTFPVKALLLHPCRQILAMQYGTRLAAHIPRYV